MLKVYHIINHNEHWLS